MICLFHSYQYLSQSKDITFNRELKQFFTKDNKFLLGLLQIPNIPNYQIVVEKYSPCKRQSKKVCYRNHNRHNTKVYIKFKKNDFEIYCSKIFFEKTELSSDKRNTQFKYLLRLINLNYLKYNENDNGIVRK